LRYSIIGAGGFLAQRVTRKLRARPDTSAISLCDVSNFDAPDDARVTKVVGDVQAAEVRARAIDGADSVIVLASILGGAAERDYAGARAINVNATLSLFEDLRDCGRPIRCVFASSIAVFATPLPSVVTDETPLGPVMTYGAQKLMMEVALSNFAKRGELDGISLRPSGIMANPAADRRMRAAFINRVFYAVRDGDDIELPVPPDATTWLSSIETVAENFVQAAEIPVDRIGTCRAITLPTLQATFADLVAALKRLFPDMQN
jgi:D-erythronate 2-dehydrogenase